MKKSKSKINPLNFFSKGKSIDKKSSKIQDEIARDFGHKTYFHDTPQPVWMNRNYTRFADEAYTKNVISYKCISLVSKLLGSVDWKLYELKQNQKTIIKNILYWIY